MKLPGDKFQEAVIFTLAAGEPEISQSTSGPTIISLLQKLIKS
jgi:hypothetical protein